MHSIIAYIPLRQKKINLLSASCKLQAASCKLQAPSYSAAAPRREIAEKGKQKDRKIGRQGNALF
jgi:hypothetical protein